MVAIVTARLRALGVAHGLLFAAVVAPLGAQDSVVVVPDAPACAACSLTVSAVVELGDREGPGIVGEQTEIGRSDDGDYYVSSLLQEGRLLRFSPDGVFLDAIGRAGEGPGEYVWPVLMGGDTDALTILDIRRFRVTTIRGGVIATARLPLLVDDFALLPDGRHVYNGFEYEPREADQPLHLYDETSGRVTHSFGGEGVRVVQAAEPPTEVRRRVAGAADGSIWAASWTRYRIDKWDPDGDRITRIERDAPWFRPGEESPGLPNEFEPSPVTLGVRDWGDGLLMVVVNVADADWRPAAPARAVQGHELLSAAQQEELFDTVIEVLDTRSGTVLARTRVDENAIGLVGRDGFYSYAEHSDLGEPKFVVWSVGLSGYNR